MERHEFDKQMRRLAGLKFAPATLDTHWEALCDMDVEVLAAAVGVAVRQCHEFPAPAQLRGLVPRERGCRYGHQPPCDTSSECTAKMLSEMRGERRLKAV